MEHFWDIHRAGLEDFRRMSHAAGARADYVQGGGGNTSVKLDGGLMAIKALGYRLGDIELNRAYAVLDLSELLPFYTDGDPDAFPDVEQAGSARAKAAVRPVDGMEALRPSVEAGFHSLLDRFVLHTHSVYANLATCAPDGREVVAAALEGADYGWGFVPYADPGARLTFSIRDELRRVERETGRRPAVIFMQNHGLIVHAGEADGCLAIHADVNRRVARAFGAEDGDFPNVTLTGGDGRFEAQLPLLREAFASGAMTGAMLTGEPLYPDQLVFLSGAVQLGGEPEPGMCAADPESGRLTLAMPRGKAQVVAETIACVAYIRLALAKSGRQAVGMDAAARAFIANWESEKYRKSVAGR